MASDVEGSCVDTPDPNLYAAVIARYAESHRRYHAIQHLDECFVNFDGARHLADKAGDRRDDFGYAAWLWLDLGNSELAPLYQGRRLAEFVANYGAIDSVDAVPAILDAQTALAERPGTTSPGTRAWARTCRSWFAENVRSLIAVANG